MNSRLTDFVRRLKHQIIESDKRVSYALDDLDRRLEPFVDFKNGFFIEAGANDGLKQTNTLYFEKYKGWSGLLIEAIPQLAEACRENRPHCIVEHAALVADDYPEETVELRYCDLMSVVKGGLNSKEDELEHVQKGSQFLKETDEIHTVTAPARTLSDILSKHGIDQIDLLSLDVEGYEAQVLRGLDLTVHRPQYMLIELREMEPIKKVLRDNYRHVASLAIHEHRQDALFKLQN
jgi:FkbM family methyltransferase